MNPFADLMTLPIEYTTASQSMRRAVREQYIRQQDGKCQFCDEPLTGPPRTKIQQSPINEKLFPPGFFMNPIHLHHDHKTDLTIGAVHARCNAYLWQYLGE